MYYLIYIDSVGQKHQLDFNSHSYPNLMELIRDQGFEEWGDCRGRAWCATCHIHVTTFNSLTPAHNDEQMRLNKLTNIILSSRLACQISLDKNIHKAEVEFIGDD